MVAELPIALVAELPVAVAEWLLTYALHSTLILGLALVLVRWLRAPALRERVLKIGALGALATTTAQLALGVTPLAGGWTLPSVPASAAIDAPREAPLFTSEPLFLEAPLLALDLADEDVAVDEETAPPTPAPRPSRAIATMAVPMAFIGWGWLAGAALALLVWASRWRRLWRDLGGRRQAPPGPAVDALATLRDGTRAAPVRLSISPEICAPMTFGFLRSEICLPARAIGSHGRDGDLGQDELRAMLAHELAHVVRRDPAWLALHGLLESLFFFQPLHRTVRRRWQEAVELVCDDWAVQATGDRLPLATCLTEVAGWIVHGPPELPVPAMAVGGAGLGDRVRRLLDDRPVASRRRALWLAPAAALVLGTIVLGAPNVAVDGARARADAVWADEPLFSDVEDVFDLADASFAEDPSSAGCADDAGCESIVEAEPDLALALAPDEDSSTPPEESTSPEAAARAPDASDAPEARSVIGPRATPAPRVPSPAPDVEDVLRGLDREVGLLEREAAQAGSELEALGAPAEWRDRIAAIQQRVAELRERRAKLDLLMRLVLQPAPSAFSITQPGFQPPSPGFMPPVAADARPFDGGTIR